MKMNDRFQLRLHTGGETTGLNHESAVIIIFTTSSDIDYTHLLSDRRWKHLTSSLSRTSCKNGIAKMFSVVVNTILSIKIYSKHCMRQTLIPPTYFWFKFSYYYMVYIKRKEMTKSLKTYDEKNHPPFHFLVYIKWSPFVFFLTMIC